MLVVPLVRDRLVRCKPRMPPRWLLIVVVDGWYWKQKLSYRCKNFQCFSVSMEQVNERGKGRKGKGCKGPDLKKQNATACPKKEELMRYPISALQPKKSPLPSHSLPCCPCPNWSLDSSGLLTALTPSYLIPPIRHFGFDQVVTHIRKRVPGVPSLFMAMNPSTTLRSWR